MRLHPSSRQALPILVGILLIGHLLLLREHRLLTQGAVAHFLDVGQGDAVLLISPSGKQVLIDGGPDVSTLEHLGKHLPFLDRTIDVLVLTHPDADHLTALPDVAERYAIGSVVLSGTHKKTARYQALLHTLEESGTPTILANTNQQIDLGDGLQLDVIWPSPAIVSTTKDANDTSVVLLATTAHSRLLLTGDIEAAAEQSILRSGQDIRADILKVPHHGSRTSSSTGFLLAVQPQLAVISAATDNPFGHPHPDVLQRYQNLGIDLRSTAEEGTITIELP